eukprot:2380122-Prymnesium_polylepis.1
MERSRGATTSVELQISPEASLQSIFSGANQDTSGSLDEWRSLSGTGYQLHCNRQGFNIQGQGANGAVAGQESARIGIYFNDQDDCLNPDSGRIVGGSTLSVATGCHDNDCPATGTMAPVDIWLRILIFDDLRPLPPPSPHPPPLLPP